MTNSNLSFKLLKKLNFKAVAEAEKLREDLNATISKLGELEAAVTA